jgi:hypothetical protein
MESTPPSSALLCGVTQKTEEFSSTAAEASDLEVMRYKIENLCSTPGKGQKSSILYSAQTDSGNPPPTQPTKSVGEAVSLEIKWPKREGRRLISLEDRDKECVELYFFSHVLRAALNEAQGQYLRLPNYVILLGLGILHICKNT